MKDMKKFFIVLIVSIFAALPLSAQMSETPCVEVVGYASAEVEPNEIWVRITIDERESNSKVRLIDLERKMLSILNGMGVDTEESLFVDGFSGTNYKRNNGVLYKNYTLKLTSAEQVTEAFGKLQDVGINRLSVTKTGRSDVAEIKSKLRVEAMKSAKARAEELAGAIGQSVGMAIYINDYNVDSAPMVFRAKAAYSLSNDSAVVEESYSAPEFTSVKLDYRVTVKFVLL